MIPIREYLKQGKPLLFDGAMGTQYACLSGNMDENCELANVWDPEEIKSIHRSYLKVGVHAIKTNTFAVGQYLAQGETALAERILIAGCTLAQRCAKDYEAYVFASMGPVSGRTAAMPAELYCRQAELFLSRGITHFLLETLPSDEGVGELARWLKQRCPEAYLIVSFAVDPSGITRDGHLGQTLYDRAAALPGVDAVGFNCVSGPHHLLEFIRTLKRSDKPLSVMPNAGYPTVLGRRTVFQGQPDYFGEKLAQIAWEGAAIVGGCCGTTPEHIAAAAAALERKPEIQTPVPEPREEHRSATPAANSLAEKLDRGQRVIAVELDPPSDDDPAFFLEGVQALRNAGADAVTIADCPIGRPRADSSLLACKIKRDLGVDPLPHMTCRDRNLNATKALLLGLTMEGIHNVLLVTGDPIPTEDRSEVKTVFNFNSRKLASYVTVLNQKLATPFRMYGALNVNAKNFEIQLRMAKEKEACGMSGFLTQPVLSREALENLKLARAELKGKILGGIYPVVSHRNACFLNNEIAGMRVCDEMIALYEGKEREEAEELAVRISTEIAKEIVPYTDGIYLMTPFKRVSLMTRILENIR